MASPIGTFSGKPAVRWDPEATKVSMTVAAFRVIDRAAPYAAGAAVVAGGILLQGVGYGVSGLAKIAVAATVPVVLPVASPVLDCGVRVSAAAATKAAAPHIVACVANTAPHVKVSVRESIKGGVTAVAFSKSLFKC